MRDSQLLFLQISEPQAKGLFALNDIVQFKVSPELNRAITRKGPEEAEARS